MLDGTGKRTRCFRVAKRGNTDDEFEDACAVDIKRSRFAIADGASQSSFAAAWAQLLVHEFIRIPVPWASRWTKWLPPLQGQWLSDIGSRHLEYYAIPKFEEGAFATFLGLVIAHRRWHAVAVGDCCVFQLRQGQLREKFPVKHSADFTVCPGLLGSRFCEIDVMRTKKNCIAGDWQEGDWFLLMTDALAQWFLRGFEAGTNPWGTLYGLLTASVADDQFQAWIREIRIQGAIRNDDVTLLAVEV
ncbi:MAG: protein phosphatase 2C domain-containing protein [Planctomycetota bacterium]|nr:protein phosphatase 2C domain-containing protein [Planctomycetota bacterium]